MALRLEAALGLTDSEDFVREVVRVMRSVISATSPDQVYVSKVDNWFGPK